MDELPTQATLKPHLIVEPVSNSYKLNLHIKFLEEAARHFERLPTNGEDKAHWANIYNAKNCRDIASEIERLHAALAKATQ